MDSHKADSMLSKVFFNKYVILRKLGEGSFGMIYLAVNGAEEYALKFESKSKGQNLLEAEAYIMNYLKGPFIPIVKSFGFSGDYNILVMELLGKSLEDIFEGMPKKKMSNKTVAMLGMQMVNILQSIHDKHIIHRDIKPDNFVLGLKDKARHIYILDFGLAKKYRSSKTLEHYPMVHKKKLTGTARYASINALRGYEQSRRDDLEAVGYVLVYFLLGQLPWQGLPIKAKEDRYAKIMEKKLSTSPKELCRDLPKELERYIEYTRELKFEEDPDYDFLRALFVSVLTNQNCEMDYIYDWNSDDKASGSLLPVCSNMNPNNKLAPLNNNHGHNLLKEQEKLISNSNVIPNPAIKAKLYTEQNSQVKDQSDTPQNQITVVNNYVNHVNNIVINSNKDNQEDYMNTEMHAKLKTNEGLFNKQNNGEAMENNYILTKGVKSRQSANNAQSTQKAGEDGLSTSRKSNSKKAKDKAGSKCYCCAY